LCCILAAGLVQLLPMLLLLQVAGEVQLPGRLLLHLPLAAAQSAAVKMVRLAH
jgi:hypothetical protein